MRISRLAKKHRQATTYLLAASQACHSRFTPHLLLPPKRATCNANDGCGWASWAIISLPPETFAGADTPRAERHSAYNCSPAIRRGLSPVAPASTHPAYRHLPGSTANKHFLPLLPVAQTLLTRVLTYAGGRLNYHTFHYPGRITNCSRDACGPTHPMLTNSYAWAFRIIVCPDDTRLRLRTAILSIPAGLIYNILLLNIKYEHHHYRCPDH